MKTIVGYSDRISAVPGDKIRFMVSSIEGKAYRAEIVRIIHGDTNPKGPGYREEKIPGTTVEGSHPGRKQEIHAGSYVLVPDGPHLALGSFSLSAMIWPTTPAKGRQALLGKWSETNRSGFALVIDEKGAVALMLGDGKGGVETFSTGKALVAREWYLVSATYDAASKAVKVYQDPVVDYARTDDRGEAAGTSKLAALGRNAAGFAMAAWHQGADGKRQVYGACYNGKIDSPRLADRALSRHELSLIHGRPVPDRLLPGLVAAWDFAADISSVKVSDASPNRLHGEVVNMPARAMKGYNWDGSEMCWRHAPEQYGAIHFHDDDLYDSGWEVDFEWVVPGGLKSGVYAAHVWTDSDEDYLPFCIRPPRGKPTAKACFLLPTASYMAYANEHMPTNATLAELLTGQLAVLYPHDVFLNEHREYGASNYDTHSDGSGVCYSSRLRPILNMRPKYASWLGGAGSSLWQFNADSHITDWLEGQGFDYDVVTDEDLHYEGLDVIAGYSVILTGSHPEYWSKQAWDALDGFKRQGGRLMYLGANGWYWRVAYHPEKPGMMEVRRAEGGIRAWAAEPGEYYHSFTGEFGGLWRRQGRPPQVMAGTGFSAQGFDISSYYKRKPDSFDPRAAFIFEGVGKDEIIGDFGLIGDGAAGLELDRADRLLGTPPNALVLASSEGHTDIYLVVCEELLINYPATSGSQSDLVRADMVFYETPSGGAVFSSSSIAWAGSLSHNGYDNNVSRITGNVLKRFLDERPF
ncbi:MAG: LamG domain-containing protein [Dongiaceae bacterium]